PRRAKCSVSGMRSMHSTKADQLGGAGRQAANRICPRAKCPLRAGNPYPFTSGAGSLLASKVGLFLASAEASRSVSKAGFAPSPNLALVDGDIGQATTAEKVAQTAIAKFGSIDHVVNNAGIFVAKSFTDYTADEFRGLASTNLE